MTTQMVRKQIYIQKRQEVLIKKLSKSRGLSEAEFIRQAIDLKAEQSQPFIAQYDHSAWEELLQLFEERTKLGITGDPYRWNRQEIYEERESRWIRDHSKEQE